MGQNKDKSLRSFEDLDVWQVCRALRSRMATLARTLPKEEQYRLADQIKRASRSATANLAEGYGRFHYGESIQFARQARGSLYELLDHLTVCRDEELITKAHFEEMREEVSRSVAVINGYIRHAKTVKLFPSKPRITNNE